MNRTRKLLAIGALAATTALATGCGGDGGGDEDPAEVLRDAFSQQQDFRSGVINIGLDAAFEGQANGSLDAQVSGPFNAQEGQQVEVDLDATADLSVEGLPQLPGGSFSFDFDGGLAIVGDSIYVTSSDTTYEASDQLFGQIQPALQVAEDSGGGEDSEQTTGEADDFVNALTNLENEGTEEVEGESTIHISGDFDFEQAQEQLGDAAPPEAAQFFESLNGSVDVFVAEEDRSPRRFDFSFAIEDVPDELAQAGFEGANLTLSVGLSEPNTEQSIEAPSGDTEPLDNLLGQFNVSESDLLQALSGGIPGAGALGGGGGGVEVPDVEVPDVGGSGDAGIDPELQECIANAEDADAISACFDG